MGRTARFQPPLTHIVRMLQSGEAPTEFDLGKAYGMVDLMQDGWYAGQSIGFTSQLVGSLPGSSITLLPPTTDATYIVFGVSLTHAGGAGTPTVRVSKGVPQDFSNGDPIGFTPAFLEIQMGGATLTAVAGNTAPWSTVSGGAPYWVVVPGEVLSLFATSDLSVAPDIVQCFGCAFAVPAGFKAI